MRAVWSGPLLVAWVLCNCWAAAWMSSGFCAWGGGGGGGAGWSGSARVGMPHCWRSHATALDFYYPILLYICALEIFAVKTTSLSKVLLLFFAFRFRAPTCQQDVITLQLRLCCTVFFPWFFKGRIFILPFECYLLLEILACTLVY